MSTYAEAVAEAAFDSAVKSLRAMARARRNDAHAVKHDDSALAAKLFMLANLHDAQADEIDGLQ